MGGSPFRALVRKELLDLLRNRGALLPVFLVTLLALVLPFTVALIVPAVTGQRLGNDTDLARLSRVMERDGALSADARIQLFLFQQFLLMFLLTPITGAMALASHSVVGEKQARTLEPLLATPITTLQLLVGKVLGALLPALGIALAGLALYFAGLWLVAAPGVLGAMLNARTAVLLLVVGPASALVSLQAALVISSRVNDARTAQQFGVLIVIPLMALMVAQFSGALWLSPALLGLIGVGLMGVWGLLVLVSIAIFDRESILTRWR
jgi:ABC-2 type transport system permease protein